MTNNQWTPEPWRPSKNYGRIVSDRPYPNSPMGRRLHPNDLARACACVNACKDIPPELLEAGTVTPSMPDLLDALIDLLALHEKSIEQYEEDHPLWGGSPRTLAQIEAAGDMPIEVIRARAAIAIVKVRGLRT